MAVVLTIEQLVEAVRYWRSPLGLTDWKINISLVEGERLGWLARSHTRLYCRELEIEISSAESRDDGNRRECDMELDLIHEMMHAVLNPLQTAAGKKLTGALEELALEQPIETLSSTLVELRRAAGPLFSWEQAAVSHGLEHWATQP